MDDLTTELLRERYGNPPTAEAPPADDGRRDRHDDPTEIARRRRVLWFGMEWEGAEA